MRARTLCRRLLRRRAPHSRSSPPLLRTNSAAPQSASPPSPSSSSRTRAPSRATRTASTLSSATPPSGHPCTRVSARPRHRRCHTLAADSNGERQYAPIGGAATTTHDSSSSVHARPRAAHAARVLLYGPLGLVLTVRALTAPTAPPLVTRTNASRRGRRYGTGPRIEIRNGSRAATARFVRVRVVRASSRSRCKIRRHPTGLPHAICVPATLCHHTEATQRQDSTTFRTRGDPSYQRCRSPPPGSHYLTILRPRHHHR